MRIIDWSSDVCSSDLSRIPQIAVAGDGKRTCVDRGAAGIAVGSREHERAQIRLHELARTGEFRRDRCGEVTPRRRAVTHADSRLRPDQLHRIASDRVAAARELHAGRQYLAKAVVDDHGAGCGGEYSETGILIGCVQRASAIGPVVVPRSTLPEAVAAVDGVVELEIGRANV